MIRVLVCTSYGVDFGLCWILYGEAYSNGRVDFTIDSSLAT